MVISARITPSPIANKISRFYPRLLRRGFFIPCLAKFFPPTHTSYLAYSPQYKLLTIFIVLKTTAAKFYSYYTHSLYLARKKSHQTFYLFTPPPKHQPRSKRPLKVLFSPNTGIPCAYSPLLLILFLLLAIPPLYNLAIHHPAGISHTPHHNVLVPPSHAIYYCKLRHKQKTPRVCPGVLQNHKRLKAPVRGIRVTL